LDGSLRPKITILNDAFEYSYCPHGHISINSRRREALKNTESNTAYLVGEPESVEDIGQLLSRVKRARNNHEFVPSGLENALAGCFFDKETITQGESVYLVVISTRYV
jgi:hypothetical protein